MSTEARTPMVRLAKRSDMSPRMIWCIRFGSILIALLLGCIPILLTGSNPIAAYEVIVAGSLSRPIYIRQTIRIAIPLLGCALAIAPCFKMRFWNIGAEGQITMGAVFASYFALFWVNRIPHRHGYCQCHRWWYMGLDSSILQG